ncbi:uncharacterized protein LOC110708619 [Chenopodium quinoa]|uniref:uncharacterized protein LOC110708619 n=1 Tax=Chenopodium quinoa TaxID=63459 RepID=UPI000B78CA43|nr:uncharacterized protein LOC110708619 [Chenopodium quinoa]
MASSSQPSLLSYHHTCSSSSSNSNFTRFPSSFSLSSLNGSTRTQFPRNLSLSLTKIHAKFDKFEGSEDNPVQLQEEEVQEIEEFPDQEIKEEDDDCLPSDLEGAVRQSGQASASFVDSGGTRAIVELLIPQLQFLDDEGAQAELWELSRVFIDTLIEETGCQKVKAIFPDTGAAALLKYQWKDAVFGFSSLSDRKPVEDEDEIVVMVVPDYQMLEYVQKIASLLSDDPPRPLIMWNPRLVSEDVGVGFNVRKLRRYFLRTFSVVYSMRPFPSGAVFRCYPGLWKVFYDDKNRPGRYLLAKELISRPDAEELEYIFGDAQEKEEEGPSLLARAAGIFSSMNRFMRVISK